MPANPYLSGHDNALTEDPLLGFNFLLEFEGEVGGYFTECSGIGSEHEIIDHKIVDSAGHEVTRKIPGRLKWGDVTLKRGITSSLQMWDWRRKVVEGNVNDARKNFTITMLDRKYDPIAIWNFSMGWPSKLTGPALKSDSNEFGIEELSIVHEGMYREQ